VSTTARPASPAAASARRLSLLAAISGLYDIALGVGLLAGRGLLVQAFGVAPPVPAIHADLNGLFALAIGAGYLPAWRRPLEWRAYLWVMGPGLKGAGALLFVADHFLRHSPAAFLIFAACDGTLAVLTAWALLAGRGRTAA
jgi:hypothetical protein